MGRYTREGTSIIDFTPDDTDKILHVQANWSSVSMTELWEKIQEKWPNITMDKVSIRAQHIHTECIGYDRYDAGDYSDYLVIEATE